MSADIIRVLLAEDHTDLRRLIEMHLDQGGFDVVQACDGQDALEKIDDAHPDVLVTDMRMPRLDGLGLVQALRADPRYAELPVLLLTATPEDPRADELLHLPLTTVMAKPPTWRELVPNIQMLVAGHYDDDPRASEE